MRNLLLFIWKNQFTFLFLLLESVGFILLTSGNSFQRSKLHEASVAFAAKVYAFQSSYTHYLGLQDENELLQRENASLRQQLLNAASPELFSSAEGFECIPATVLNSTYHLEKNFAIIDKGRLDGVIENSGVIGPEGVVGIVRAVSDHYASVLPLLHSDCEISARLLKTDYFGQCRWHGIDDQRITLENIPNHVVVNAGDTVVTRGSGAVFPAGLIVGFAESSERDESSGFQEIELRLGTNFRRLNSVYIITNAEKPEWDSLMTNTESWIE